jgi:hypothetical protein
VGSFGSETAVADKDCCIYTHTSTAVRESLHVQDRHRAIRTWAVGIMGDAGGQIKPHKFRTESYFISKVKKSKSKVMSLTGRVGIEDCEMLRIPHYLDNQLSDCGKFVSFTHRPRSTLQKKDFSAVDTHFCQRLSKTQGLVRPEGLRKFIHFSGSRTREVPVCSIVP